jgi:hypothetical protein
MSIENIRRIKAEAGLSKNKKAYSIPKKSAKKLKQEAEEKKLRGDDDTLMEQWFKARRKELTGICQCGCAKPSQKKDDTFFRGSCCHIFPKATFESIMYHPLNCVERAMFGGCHHNMDNQGLDRWPAMADFEDIKERFRILAPLLTDEERATKFYSKLEKIIYENP